MQELFFIEFSHYASFNLLAPASTVVNPGRQDTNGGRQRRCKMEPRGKSGTDIIILKIKLGNMHSCLTRVVASTKIKNAEITEFGSLRQI